MLSLAEARKTGRLEEFIRQCEASGLDTVDENDFLLAVETVSKHETQSDRTSRLSSRDGSTGK